VQTGVIVVGRAGPNKTPENVITSNITDTSFTVNFTTEAETVAGLSVEGGRTPFLTYDDRNKNSGSQKAFLSHYITVSNLNPETSYQFSILSDGETYLENGQKYVVKTGKKITASPPKQTPIIGKVLLASAGLASDTIVKVEIPKGQVLTGLTRNSGEFVIPTNALRTADLVAYLPIQTDDIITITFFRQNLKTSLKIPFKNASAIPPVTLEQEYDFTDVKTKEDATIPAQLKIPPATGNKGDIKITTPKVSESFIDNKPRFTGTALPNKSVKITIQSDPIKAVVFTDSNGVWSYRPAIVLAPGQHTITIETVDNFGILRTISRVFSVFPSGAQIADSATPSATPITTPTPTKALITPTVTVGPSQAPGASASPTLTPPTQVPTITSTPSPTIIVMASPTSIPVVTKPVQVPPSGNSTPVVLTVISAFLIIAGSALLFLL